MREYSSCYTRESSASLVNTLALLVLLSNLTDPPVSVFRPTSDAQSTLMHTMSAASAGAIATMATHPFDVIKVWFEQIRI